jgi:hypothetical protein
MRDQSLPLDHGIDMARPFGDAVGGGPAHRGVDRDPDLRDEDGAAADRARGRLIDAQALAPAAKRSGPATDTPVAGPYRERLGGTDCRLPLWLPKRR